MNAAELGTVPGEGQGAALISVIVPAYNAAATLDRTVASIARQSYGNIEIIVVDDGSRDDTAARVRALAAQDSRITLLQQVNGGVARARNAGIAAARGELIGLIDADDLWTPDALRLLSARMATGGPDMALAYGGYSVIDDHDRILRTVMPGVEGDVRNAIVQRNFVGSGSGVLIRKAALMEVGGYDPALRDQDAQGCEDHLLYFRLAQQHRFGFVAMALLGYRHAPGAMSGNVAAMMRSHALCMDAVALAGAADAATITRVRRDFALWLFGRAVEQGNLRAARLLFCATRRAGPVALVRTIIGALRRRLLVRPGAYFS